MDEQTETTLSRLAGLPPADQPIGQAHLSATPPTPPVADPSSPAAPSEHVPAEEVSRHERDWRTYEDRIDPITTQLSPPSINPIPVPPTLSRLSATEESVLPSSLHPAMADPVTPSHLPALQGGIDESVSQVGPSAVLTPSVDPGVKPANLRAGTSEPDLLSSRSPSSTHPQDGLNDVVSLLTQVVRGIGTLSQKKSETPIPSSRKDQWKGFWTPDELPDDMDWTPSAPSFHSR